jgi:hypothetical protein
MERGWCGALPIEAAWAVEPLATLRVAERDVLNSTSSGQLQPTGMPACSLKSYLSAVAVVCAYRGLLGYNSVVWKVDPNVSEEYTNSIIRLGYFYLVVWVMTLGVMVSDECTASIFGVDHL